MKILLIILAAGLLLVSGCATFNHSEYIDTDQTDAFASGAYKDNSMGATGSYNIGGAGGGWGAASGGFGAGLISLNPGPPATTPYMFARSIAMINYSKKLKSIKYDETGGIIEYEFAREHFTKPSSAQAPSPSQSFGYQPVQ